MVLTLSAPPCPDSFQPGRGPAYILGCGTFTPFRQVFAPFWGLTPLSPKGCGGPRGAELRGWEAGGGVSRSLRLQGGVQS